MLLDHLVSGDWSEANNVHRVVTAAKNAEIDELGIANPEALQNFLELDLADRLLFRIESAQ